MHPIPLRCRAVPRRSRPATAMRLAVYVAALASVLVLLPADPSGQTEKSAPPSQPELAALVTDADDFALSPNFGQASGYTIGQDGDFVFQTDGTTLFVRRAGAAAATPLLPMLDEAPGYPGSRGDTISGLGRNSTGQIRFEIDFFPVAGSIRHAIYVYDESGFHVVADSADVAPDTGGRTFGRGLTSVGFNDAGQVGLQAPLVAITSTEPSQNALFLTKVGGPTVRIVGQGDVAPGTGGGTFSGIWGSGLSAAGELVFSAAVVGGNGGYGLFRGSTAGVSKIVSHGDPLPSPLVGTFNFLTWVPARFVNQPGQVAFAYQGQIFVDDPASGLSVVVRPSDPTASHPGVRIGGDASIMAFGGGGQIALNASLGGLGPNNRGLLRYTSAGGLELVAHLNLGAPGAGSAKFSVFNGASMNAAGLMTFHSGLSGGTNPRGIFQQAPGGAIVKIALEGEPTPLAGGGRFGLGLSNSTTTLLDGSALFLADVLDGAAWAGTFLARGGAISSVTSTEDPLPAGTRVSLRTFTVGVGGDLVVFAAAPAGGQFSLWAYDMRNRRKTRIVADGDPVPDMAGRLRVQSAAPMAVNEAGEMAFSARLIGGPGYPGNGVFLRTRTGDLRKIVAQGDVDQATGRTFTGITLGSGPPTPLNDAGQVVFRATLAGTPTSNPVGVFVGAVGVSPAKVALSGEAAPLAPATTFSTFGTAGINNVGRVAFQASAADGRQGLYVASPGNAPVKIAASLDPGPSGSTFPATMPGQFDFNDLNEVVFMTPLDHGPGGAVFAGSPGSLVPIALNGGAAPSGGNFVINSPRPGLSTNSAGDLVFRADLAGGTANSGLFLIRRSDGVTRTIALQGQAAPGSGVFTMFTPPINNVPGETCYLTAGGDALLSVYTLTSAGDYAYSFFRFTTDNVLQRIFARGDKAPQSNGGLLLGATQVRKGSSDASGRYYFAGYIAGKKVSSAIYVTR